MVIEITENALPVRIPNHGPGVMNKDVIRRSVKQKASGSLYSQTNNSILCVACSGPSAVSKSGRSQSPPRYVGVFSKTLTKSPLTQLVCGLTLSSAVCINVSLSTFLD